MALPSDQQLAKLRILMKRAQDIADKADEDVSAAQRVASEKHQAVSAIWHQFAARAEELGYCPLCEVPKSQCKGHIGIAA